MRHPHLPSPINSRNRFARPCVLALAAGLAMHTAMAAEIDKANNSDSLNLTTSWVGGVPPGTNDTATWNSTVTGPNTTTLGASTAWLGIKVTTPGGPILINADGNTLTNGSVNVAGNVGIDMSAATADLTLSNNVVVTGPQTWNIAPGRTLLLGSGFTRNEAGVIFFNLPDSTAAVIITNGSDVLTTTATPNAILGGVTAFGNNYFGTVNDIDFAALMDAPGGGFQIAAGSTIGGLYTANLSGTLDPGNANVIDFTEDDAATTGLRASNTRTWSGFRFNQPQNNALNVYNGMNAWQINIPSGRTATGNAILITTNVGPSPVLIDNGGQTGGTPGFYRIGNGGAQDLLIYQNNPAAPLVVQPNISISQQGTGNLVKMGVGTMIIQSPATSYTGQTRIYGGTLMIDTAAGLSTSPITVYAGTLAETSGSISKSPTVIFTGATNSINLNTNGGTVLDNSNLTFNASSRLQFVYSNSVVPSATIPALMVTNINTALTANGSVTVDIICGGLSVGQFPLIKYIGTIGGTGGAAFSLGNLEPHSSGYISNNIGNNSIDLVITNVTQPLTWTAGSATWDTSTANFKDTLGNPATYQEIGVLGDGVIFDDSTAGASPITVNLNTSVIPASVAFNNSAKNYVVSGPGSVNGLGALTKSGTGSLTLSTTNDFTGGLNINNGTLVFNSLTNLGLGVINFNGGTLTYANTNVDDISVRAVTLNANASTINDGGNVINFAHPIGNNGTGNFTKSGSGTLTLNGTNLYSGKTVVAQGTLALGASSFIRNSTGIIVNSGSTLDTATSGVGLTLNAAAQQQLSGVGTVSGTVTSGASTSISPATNGVIGTLNIVGDLLVTGGTLQMDASTGTRDVINVSGNLQLTSGSMILNITGTLPNGTYKLIQYSGSLLSGAGSSGNLTLSGFSQPSQTGFLIDSTPGEIDLFVGPAASDSINWSPSGTTWDLAGTADWLKGATPWSFTNGDAVTFDDTGAPTVNLSTSVRPGSVTVTNNSVTYTFADGTGTGGAKISGLTGITKSGTGTLIIQTANNNNGPTVINGGTIQVGNTGIGDIGLGAITNNGALVFAQGDNANHDVPGLISGSGSVTENAAATTILEQNNTYTGPTTISSGTLQVGSGGAAGSLGTNLSITNNGTLAFDRSGTLALAQNISGSGSVALMGTAAVTFTGPLSYQGNTAISNGTVKLTAANQIPDGDTVPGSIGFLGVGGTFDLAGFNESVNGLSDLGLATGSITNTGTSVTNTLTIGTVSGGLGTNTYTGKIVEKTNAHIALVILGAGNQTLANTNNNYSGGTLVGGGATLTLGTPGGTGIPGNVSAGTGSITMSNNTTLFLNGNVTTFPANPVTIVPGATVSFNSQNLGNQYSGLISGGATATNVIIGPWTGAGTSNAQWNAFSGTVLVPSGGDLRVFGSPGGGTNATFDIEGTGQLQTRSTEVIAMARLVGTGSFGSDVNGAFLAGGITGPNAPPATGNFVIGTGNQSSTYGGTISGTNNIFKTGTGTLTLIGTTNAFTSSLDVNSGTITTNYFATNGLSYTGATAVTNGTLAIVAPANLNGPNFLSFTLAGNSAVLDLSSQGSSPDGVTLVTNSTLQLGSGQTLTGLGTLKGSVVAGAGSTVSAALAANTNGVPSTGALNITGSIELGGAVNININATNTPNSGEIVASAITVDPTATLTVTNLGPEAGATFHLFNHAVSFTTPVTLPPTTGTNTWINNLAVDGSITLNAPALVTVNTNPTNVVFGVSNGSLTLSWPADHIGWRLLSQTNPIGTGITTNWVPVGGSQSTDVITGPLNPSNNVFFRMTFP